MFADQPRRGILKIPELSKLSEHLPLPFGTGISHLNLHVTGEGTTTGVPSVFLLLL